MITLVKDTIDNKDIDRLVDWLKTYPRLTKGLVTLEFEKKFSDWLGMKYSVFCNSGSSANLLMLSVLKEKYDAKKVVVPSVAWSTDLAPVMQLGMKPILCDCNMKDLSVDLKHLEEIFQQESPDALLLVSVLGLVPDMNKIVELCFEYRDKKLGTFGKMSSFSTFFGHHISTIEGGFIATDDLELYELLVAMRSHGWTRDLSVETQLKLQEEWTISEFDSLYTFYYTGYNFRSTDLQAYIGLAQIDKLDEWGRIRARNFETYQKLIENDYWKPDVDLNDFISNFAYPVIHPDRDLIVDELKKNDIEVRPMICGSMGTQPFYVKKYGKLYLDNVTEVDTFGFYVPNHPKLTEDEIELICNIVNWYTL
jgi:CDP-6-deoxy-D-xylo-4-hexulose-3-dehydrase